MDANLDLPLLPLPDPDTAGFWAGMAEGELRLCRCEDCRRWLHPPLERCRHCAGPTGWEPVSGSGVLYSFVVIRQAMVQGFRGDAVPYVIGLVELDEQPGLRMSSRIVDVEPEAVVIGSAVRARLVEVPGSDLRVPVFSPT